MDELTINIRLYHENGETKFDYSFEAYVDGDDTIEDDLEDSKKFRQAVEDLANFFNEVVGKWKQTDCDEE